MSRSKKSALPYLSSLDEPLLFEQPVEVLRIWLSNLIDELENLQKPRRGRNRFFCQLIASHPETKEGWRPVEKVSPRIAVAHELAQLVWGSGHCVGKWLRWGLGERAGEFETAIRKSVSDLSGFFEMVGREIKLSDDFRPALKSFRQELLKHYEKIVHAATDPSDAANDELYTVLATMRGQLSNLLDAHQKLRPVLGGERPEGIGDAYSALMTAACNFERIEQLLRPSLQLAVYDARLYRRWMGFSFLFMQVRTTFDEHLRGWKVEPGLIPAEIHEHLRGDGTLLLRCLDATIAKRPPRNEPMILRQMIDLETNHVHTIIPIWDPTARQLRIGKLLCKQFKTSAKNQELV